MTNNKKPIFKTPWRLTFMIAGLLFVLLSCGEDEQVNSDIPTDTTQALSTHSAQDAKTTNEEVFGSSIIGYRGAQEDKVHKALATFAPLENVRSLALKSIEIRDSLERIVESNILTSKADSLVFVPHVDRAYKAILAYQEWISKGSHVESTCPSLLKLTRKLEDNDSSLSLLPKVGASYFKDDASFFFLGGSPFLFDSKPTDGQSTFLDPEGKPETRFETDNTENGDFLLNSLYHFKPLAMQVKFGHPLSSYDSGPQEVKGIGWLYHQLSDRFPVQFITESGLVDASLVSLDIKLVDENLGCNSDQPVIRFACAQNISADKILGIYFPFKKPSLASCAITRLRENVWLADFDGDGIADLAGVSCTFSGMSSDAMAEAIWYLNLNGEWRIIEWGQELDCT